MDQINRLQARALKSKKSSVIGTRTTQNTYRGGSTHQIANSYLAGAKQAMNSRNEMLALNQQLGIYSRNMVDHGVDKLYVAPPPGNGPA